MANGEQDDAAMPAFRLVRSFGPGISTSEAKAYRVETAEPMTEKEALALMRRLGSGYQGMRYDDDPFRNRDAAPA